MGLSPLNPIVVNSSLPHPLPISLPTTQRCIGEPSAFPQSVRSAKFTEPTTSTYPCSDVWTSEIPLELLQIIQEDINQPNPPSHPADCDIPVAPFVPRFLEDSILNIRKREGEEPRFEHVYRDDHHYLYHHRPSIDIYGGTTLGFSTSLNVPSHAVLDHVSTCTMQGEVVGLASTARYKAKYMSTLYYKPM